MGMMDAALAAIVKGLNVRSKVLDRDRALKAAAELGEFVAIEITYKGQPVRMIVAMSASLESFGLKAQETPRNLPASSPVSVVET